MTPIPHAASFAELNAMLAERCRWRQDDRAACHSETIGERLVADLAAIRPLPATPLEPCEKRMARVSSLVRYRCNGYSVPTTFGFRDVLVKGFVDEVVILCAGEEIARHRRDYVFHPGRSHRLSPVWPVHGKIDLPRGSGRELDMLISLHKQATTTPKIRAAIQASKEPAWIVAERYGISEQTVWKWRKRDSVHDRSHTAHRLQTTLTPAQEAVAVALRRSLLLPLDDLLALAIVLEPMAHKARYVSSSTRTRIKAAKFPAVKSFDTFDFTAIPPLNKMLVLELARRESFFAGRM